MLCFNGLGCSGEKLIADDLDTREAPSSIKTLKSEDKKIPPECVWAIHVPERLALRETSRLTVFVRHEGQDWIDVGDKVQWSASDTKILSLESESHVKGLALGAAELAASYGGCVSDSYKVQVVEKSMVEARGLWVNRWAYRTEKDIERIISKAAGARFNQIYFQVRGAFDAYYDSPYEPWAKRLSGKLGKDPGWDPLRYAVALAHEKGLELHAWINVFTCGESTRPHPDHPLSKNPQWIMRGKNKKPMSLSGGYIWCSPGNSGLRRHNVKVAADIAERYAIDGLHLDRIRYPSPDYSYDPDSLSIYADERSRRPNLEYAQWQREQVVSQVAEIHEALNYSAPEVVLSAAVAGITTSINDWRNVTEGYHDWLQDSQAMMDGGYLDVLIPMVYWRCADEYGSWTDFRALVDHHAQSFNQRFLYIGSDILAASDASGSYGSKTKRMPEPWSQIISQIEHVRSTQGVDGWLLYDFGTLEKAGYWDELASGPFNEPASIPQMWWKQYPFAIE